MVNFYTFDELKEGDVVVCRNQIGKVSSKTVDGENADGKLGFVQVRIGSDTYVFNGKSYRSDV